MITMAKNHSKSTLRGAFLGVFGLILASTGGCAAFQSAREPSAEDALEGLKTACVAASLVPNLPKEASEACDLVNSVEIKVESE